MSQQDHTHWWRDGDASAAPSSLQIGHHQAVVSPVRDECCAGAAGRSPRRTDSKEQRHEPAAWMSRRLVSTAVLTSGMTASDRERELRYLASSQRESWPLLRDMARSHFLLRPTLQARVAWLLLWVEFSGRTKIRNLCTLLRQSVQPPEGKPASQLGTFLSESSFLDSC